MALSLRFWAKVRQCAHGDFCPFCCWEWTASRSPAGYGYFGVKEGNKWFCRLAHTVAWTLVNGRSIPAGLGINHHCDNPPCCSIWHLYAGTMQQNILDAQRRGRLAVGEARSHLKTADVLSLQDWYRQGATLLELGNKLGTTEGAIHGILTGRSWKHIPAALSNEERHAIVLSHKRRPRGKYKKRIIYS
jgi:hypothetical protein